MRWNFLFPACSLLKAPKYIACAIGATGLHGFTQGHTFTGVRQYVKCDSKFDRSKERNDIYFRFDKWARSVGILWYPGIVIDFCSNGSGRGMFLRGCTAAKGDILIHVPQEVLVHSKNIERTDSTNDIAALRMAGLDDRGVLALWLLRQKSLGESGEWKCYMDMLPSQIDVTLSHILLSEEPLNGTLLDPALKDMRFSIGRQLLNLTRLCKELGLSEIGLSNLSGQELEKCWKWAHALVLSRSGIVLMPKDFTTKASDAPICIIPVVDFVNHSNTPNAQVRFNSDGSVDLIAIRDICPNEEIFISYWLDQPLSSEQCLFSFGFSSGVDRFALPQVTFEGADTNPRKTIQKLLLLDAKPHSNDDTIYLHEIPLAVTYFAIEEMDENMFRLLLQSYMKENGVGPKTSDMLSNCEHLGRKRLREVLHEWGERLGLSNRYMNKGAVEYITSLRKSINTVTSTLDSV